MSKQNISQEIELEHRAQLRILGPILRSDSEHPQEARERLVNNLKAGRLEFDPAFKASCELQNVGPKNDYNGLRSAAQNLIKDWDATHLQPAIRFYQGIVFTIVNKETFEFTTITPAEFRKHYYEPGHAEFALPAEGFALPVSAQLFNQIQAARGN